MRELTQGLTLAADGTLSVVAAEASGAGQLPTGARIAAAVSTAALALVAPLWAALPAGGWRRVAVIAGLVAAIVIAFQSVAAGRASAVVLLLPPALLLAEAIGRWLALRREPT
jgi:hypothetical protein